MLTLAGVGISAASTSASSTFQSASGVTHAPRPWRIVTTPRSSRLRSSSRTTPRLTPSCLASSISGGSRSPGLYASLAISSSSVRIICWCSRDERACWYNASALRVRGVAGVGVVALGALTLPVLGAQLARRRVAGGLVDADVPEALGARQQPVPLDRDDDQGRAVLAADGVDGGGELVERLRAVHRAAHAARVGGVVDVDVGAGQAPVAVRVAGAQLVAEVSAGLADLQRADRLVAAVLDDDHVHVEALLDCGHELGVAHQVGAVADHDEDR